MSFLDTTASSLGPARRMIVAAVGALALTVAAGAGCGSGGSTSQRTGTTGAGSSSITTASEAESAPSTTVSETSDSTVTTSAPGGPTTSAAGVTSSTAPGVGDVLPPSGTFLSSHRLSLSGAGVPSNARSVCRTSPGAKCWLTFTKDGKNVSLPAEETGDDGVATWDWSPSDIGLTLGHWDVTITAQSGSRHEVVHEAIGLDVVA